MKTLSVVALCGLLLAVVACGSETGDGSADRTGSADGRPVAEQGGPSDHDPDSDLESPAPITVQHGEASLTLDPVTYCWKSGCADGVPPEKPADLGAVGEPITVHLDETMTGWDVEGTQISGDYPECGQHDPLEAEQVDERTWTLVPIGDPGTYLISLSAYGDGGDATTYFQIDSELTSPWPAPEATFDGIWLKDGDLGMEYPYVHIDGLEYGPKEASLQVTVTAGDARTDFPMPSAGSEECGDSAASVSFEANTEDGSVEIPKSPTRFDFELELNGETYTATLDLAEQPPRDQTEEENLTTLEFTPDLPAR